MRSALLLAIVLCLVAGTLVAQERSPGSAAASATAQERLLMEQIDQLAADGQIEEAIASLERLVDNAEQRVIELGPVQRAATLAVQVHVPVSRWAQWRLRQWAARAPEAIQPALRSEQEIALRATAHAQERHDAHELQRIVDRYSLAPASLGARLFLSDLVLDRGWTVAARQALDAPGLAVRVPWKSDDKSTISPAAGLPWPTSWPHLKKSDKLGSWLDRSVAALGPVMGAGSPAATKTAPDEAPYGQQPESSDWSSDRLAVEVARRLVSIAALDCPQAEFADTCEWASALAERLSGPFSQELAAQVVQARQWFEQRQEQRQAERSSGAGDQWLTFAGNAARNRQASGEASVSQWPTWSRPLERLTGSSDRSSASKPPVAESTLGLVSYHPLVHAGRVYINELTRIVAFDLNDGSSWPPIDPALPVFDSGMTAANYLPFGYALIGVPRGTLTIDRDTLYARMGPPVTGWYGRAPRNAEGPSAGSLSYLIALDLARQGSMLPGYPVRLPAEDFAGAEFEGCPLVSEDLLIAAIGIRDNVNLRRSVVAIERESGAIAWRSPTLASGTVSGSEQASLIAHQLVTVSGGRIFVNTNLGAIACLDQATGQIVWLARYRRSPASIDRPYPQPDRFRYRDLTPCLVTGTQVICAPQDCPEIFALDATSGDLLWSTDAERVDDATQLLGVSDDSVVVSGDRIFWLERTSGRVLASFPGGSTSDAATSLPTPRGFGRGVVGEDRVYWPTQQELFVFDADQSDRQAAGWPVIRQRIALGPRGAEGGNLVLLEDGLMIAAPSRLFVFKNR